MSKKNSLTYAEKIAFVRQFDVVPRGKLTKGKKISITKRFNKYKRLESLSFVKAKKSTLKNLKKSGVIVTDKGFFIGTRGNEKYRVLNDGTIFSQLKDRYTYVITLSPSQIIRLVENPEYFLETYIYIKYDYIFKKYPKSKYKFYLRLMFKWGHGTIDYTMDRLHYYMVNMPDVFDSRTGKVRRYADDKKKEIAAALIGIKLMFYRGNAAYKKAIELETKNANAKKPKAKKTKTRKKR